MPEYLIYKGYVYVVPESEFHDPTWTDTDKQEFMMAVAAQFPKTKSTYEHAIHVARMWIYSKRGCKYPSQWTSALQTIADILG